MELITVHVFGKQFVMIYCPFCGIIKRLVPGKFKDTKHKITARCTCGNRFVIQFNFRKNYRKSVSITGEFMTLAPRISTEEAMVVNDLSTSGVCLNMLTTAAVNIGDELLVKFNLDNVKQSLIQKKVVVRFVNDDNIGCEFTESSLYEKELGFYLFS